MKKTVNYYLSRAEILRRAWTLQRQTVSRYPDADKRGTFALCLREAWAEARQPQTLDQFRALPGEEQLEILRKFAARCPSYAARAVKITEDPETGEKIKTPAPAAWAQWMQPRSAGGLELEPWSVAVDTVAAEAYIGLDRQPEDLPLGIILARAAKAACMRLSRVYRDAPNNRKRSRTQDGSGAILDPVSMDDPDYQSTARYPSPEGAAVTREAVRTAARDDVDLMILDLRAQGYTLQDCARAAGMSHPAVIKRLRKMQQRLQDGGTVEAWLSGDDLQRPERQPRPRTWHPDNASSAPGSR